MSENSKPSTGAEGTVCAPGHLLDRERVVCQGSAPGGFIRVLVLTGPNGMKVDPEPIDPASVEWDEDTSAQSGYTPCACRDCMDTTVSSDVTKPELCSECEDAGCEPFPRDGWKARVLAATSFECQRDDAYEG